MSEDKRSTERLQAAVVRADAAGEAIVLTGNTGDVFVTPAGDPCRLPYLLAGMAPAKGRGCLVYSSALGARQLPPPGCSALPLRLPPVDAPPEHALGTILRQLATSAHPVLFVVDWSEFLIPPHDGTSGDPVGRLIESLSETVTDPAFTRAGHRLVIVGRTGGVDERLIGLPGFSSFEVGLPDRAERLCLIERLAGAEGGRKLHLSDGLTAERLASLTGGLSLDDLLRARDETGAEHPLTPTWVQARKGATLRRTNGESLTVYPPGAGLRGVAGLPQVRRLVAESQATDRVPRRILLAGPPGVGKSLVVVAIADELGLPAVALGQFRSRFVGDSERNIRRVLSTVDALSPCVLHIDEFDQAVGQRNTGSSADGGTSERVFAELLTFLGDNQRAERVTVIATSNRPDALDSAMFDRFTIVPVLHPTPEESVAILTIGADREHRTIDRDEALEIIVGYDQLLTGRVVIDVLERAMTFADLTGSVGHIAGEHLRGAFADLLMALDPVEHEYLALQAIQLCTFRSYLPWVAADYLGETPHLPSYLTSLLGSDGELDAEKVQDRLNQLKGVVHVS